MVYHPLIFGLAVIIPIPKNKRASKCDYSNYRATAISSLLCKILDNIIFKDQYTYLSTDVLQFRIKVIHLQLFVSIYYWR